MERDYVKRCETSSYEFKQFVRLANLDTDEDSSVATNWMEWKSTNQSIAYPIIIIFKRTHPNIVVLNIKHKIPNNDHSRHLDANRTYNRQNTRKN